MAQRLNNTGRNIAVAKNNGYTVEKVQKAVEFVKHAKRRSTKLEEYLKMYNYLRGANEQAPNCKVCGMSKYIASVENYAKYGYLTLVASGVDPDILNGNKANEDEGSNRGNSVDGSGQVQGDTKETDTEEAQNTSKEVSQDNESEESVADGDGSLQDEADATEPKKTNSTPTTKAKSKRTKK